MLPSTSRSILRTVLTLAAAAAIVWDAPLSAQTAKPQAPARRPAPQKPAAPAPKPAAPAAKPAEPPAPPKPVAQDLRFKTVYTAGDQRTESVSFQKGVRERFEFADMVLLKQHDLKRTVQISRTANTYLVVPDGAAPMPPTPVPAATAPPTPGVVAVTTTVVDTGERKPLFGLQARRVRTTIDRQPMPGACDPEKQRIETDGWYVDVPAQAPPVPDAGMQAPAGACVDQIKATQNGDAKALGFPVGYTMTMTGADGKPNVVTMEVLELEVTTLDAALFEVPPGVQQAGDIRALSQAVSDANEAKLAQEFAAAPAVAVAKTPGVIRVGVPEVLNKTAQQVDTRALRARLVADLTVAQIDAVPLAASQPDLAQQAGAHGFDYVLVAEVTELKVPKGGLGGMLRSASKVAGAAASSKEPTEASVAIKLVQPDGKARLSSTVKGKDGGFDVKTGLGVARFAGTMYMNVMTGRMMMNALKSSTAGNLQGMGMLGNPALMNMQAQAFTMPGMTPGIGAGMPMRMGFDPTAGAASFLMQQAMTSDAAPGGVPGQSVSFDEALGDALENATKAVTENLKKTGRK
jgi:hypothetical protein